MKIKKAGQPKAKKAAASSKEIIKKTSSGGFIFYIDKSDFCVYVLLIKHTNGEVWIPKGKLEAEETQIDAAFREIKEEVGIDYHQLRYIDLCATDSYSYDLDDKSIMCKELFINVFSVESKITPNPTDWKDLASADWYTYKDALNIIAFNKLELERAYDMFIKSVNQVNRLVDIAIEKISSDISKLPCASNIVSIYLYGSIYKKIHKADIKDTDMSIIIKDDKVDITSLFVYLQKYFDNHDCHIYTQEEIKNDISFFTREFVIEYITKGLLVYGKDILREEFKKVTKEQYVESIFIRSAEYLQLVRKVYYSNDYNFEYKLNYLKKYATRLARCVILMKGYALWDELERMPPNQIISLLYKNKHLPKAYKVEMKESEMSLGYYYKLFCDIGRNLHAIRSKLKPKS